MSPKDSDSNSRMKLFQPVGSVTGRLTVALGASMLVPVGFDWFDGNEGWTGTLIAAFLTMTGGAALAEICRRDGQTGLSRPQAFLLTVLVWLILPVFGALPFVFGPFQASYTDAFFEAMSGLTTTGATVFTGLDDAPRGMLLWRAMLQWFGGVGIVVVAMVFLPMLKVGGMQFFHSEGFDIGGNVLPRATELSGQLAWIYIGLTVACMFGYAATGMTPFEALCHAMTTVSTGGMGTRDSSFDSFPAATQYVAVVFMWLAAWPFLRFIQLSRGNTGAILRDPQIRAFVVIVIAVSLVMTVWLAATSRHAPLEAIREALFNVSSIMTGTGYASDDYYRWGGFPVAIFFALGLIGGCTGSTSCSAKIFRYQVLWAALQVQLKRLHSPHGVFPLHYDHRPISGEVLSSVMGFFFFFAASLVLWALLLSLAGEDTITAISGSVAALANVGPGLGDKIGPAGSYAEVSELSKWILSAGMLLGRLEFMSVLVLLTPAFWAR